MLFCAQGNGFRETSFISEGAIMNIRDIACWPVFPPSTVSKILNKKGSSDQRGNPPERFVCNQGKSLPVGGAFCGGCISARSFLLGAVLQKASGHRYFSGEPAAGSGAGGVFRAYAVCRNGGRKSAGASSSFEYPLGDPALRHTGKRRREQALVQASLVSR